MPRLRTGSIRERDGKIYARVTWVDRTGRQRETSQKCDSRTEAHNWIQAKQRELEDEGDRAIDAARLTFNQLAEYYEENYLTAPEYVDGRKVTGLRTYKNFKTTLKMLRNHFGAMRVREITHGDLQRFRRERLREPVNLGHNRKAATPKKERTKQRAIATVNRELAILRRVLGVAQKQGWIKSNPFSMGDSLISPADEKKRERVLSRDEESRLLAACVEKRRHLRPIIICALDTGMRAGEIFSLTWDDVDLDGRRIVIRAFNTKTMRAREVPISARLAVELQELLTDRAPGEPLVFGIRDTIKRAWATACKMAGVADLRFHDLRHTCATRLVQGQMPLPEIARILGHTTTAMTFRYINADTTTTARAAEILDRMNSETQHKETVN